MSLKWHDKRYATGIAVVDAQHKEMFDHVDQLLRASETDARNAELVDMIDFLGGYAEEHFKYEEAVMEQHACPSRDENKQDHEEFLKRLGEVRARFEHEGNTPPVRETVMGVVSQWLETHIAKVDGKLRECVS